VGEGVLISGFSRRDGALYCEGVSAETIADAAGTPTFVYSASVIRDRYRRLTAALADVPHRVHYSLKANSSCGLLSVLRSEGSAVDVVSGGELYRAQRTGYGGSDIIFGGVGKTAKELREALVAGVKFINPEVTVENLHHYISTGEKGHKFGIPHDEALAVAKTALGLKHIALLGLDMHVGSQLSTFDPYKSGLDRLAELTTKMREIGAPLRYVDIGGGLPVPYGDGDAVDPDLEGYARIVVPAITALGAELIVEPGRFFAAACGVLLARVLYRKHSGGKQYVIADAGMSELLRPSHYDAFHLIEAVTPRGGRSTVDVVGPVCESGDFLALEREMDDVHPGDLIVIHTAGAYGYVMSSNYNARPKAAEVMVDGDRFAVVTARESYDDLVRLEQADPNWRSA
jgi:diaminopimelate decarboxylase